MKKTNADKSGPAKMLASELSALRQELRTTVRDLKERGARGVGLYPPTMYLMSGLLVIALICNLFVRLVDKRFHFRETNPQA